MAKWREKERRTDSGQEISTLVNVNVSGRLRYMLQCLVINRLPLRGSVDAFDSREDASCWLFLSLFEYTLRKDSELAKILLTIPQNAR